MKISRVSLKNFRCFDALDVELGAMTVLIAENGGGKSSVLVALRVALARFVVHFHDEPAPQWWIDDDDVRAQLMPTGDVARQYPSVISIAAESADRPLRWTLERESFGTATASAREPRSTARDLLAAASDVARTRETELPFVAFYGTQRLWTAPGTGEQNPTSDESLPMRTDGYQDCLSPVSQFEHFRMWFTAEFRAFREHQAIAIEQGRPLPEFPPSVRAVRAVVDAILKEQTGWHSLEYRASERALVLSHPVQGLIPVSRLSDGIRGVVALVADIAARCVQLNPAFGAEAPQKTSGVVLIDEIDLHLHPRWQQVILPLLRSAFPKLQFVVTTHSPQVLSSVHASEIRVLSLVPREGEPSAAWTALPPGDESYGQSNQDVLERVMGTHSRPPVEGAADLARLTELVDQGAGEKDEAKRLFETLQTDFSDDLRALRRTLERRRLLAERAGRGTKV